MDKLNGELHWPKEERSIWDVEPLSDLGIKLFLGRCDWREARETTKEKNLRYGVVNEGTQCVLVSDRTVRTSTIRNYTHDAPRDAAESGLGLDEDGAIAGGAEHEEGHVVSDYDGDDDE